MKQEGNEKNILQSGFSKSLKFIGGNFRLPILYALMINEKMRFNELKRFVSNISARSLTMTLREMEDDGLIVRNEISHFPLCVEYSITKFASTLFPILDDIDEWGDNLVDKEEE